MTFSIVARDPRTGAFGVATATGGPAVGSLVPYARAGVGAVATQGYTTNPQYGFGGLDAMARGVTSHEALDRLTSADAGRQRRQCVMIDREGRTAAWTGEEIAEVRGALTRDGVAVAGNLLASPQVLKDMMSAFEKAPGLPLADRLLAAMLAGEKAGGDSRGTRSAALKVYDTEDYPAVDLRVDWSVAPIEDLGKVLAATREDDYATFFARLPTREMPGRA
ncbi:MAG TPA: DUF1028 domain-containing protein [Devosiaceae bacterium]